MWSKQDLLEAKTSPSQMEGRAVAEDKAVRDDEVAVEDEAAAERRRAELAQYQERRDRRGWGLGGR